MSQDLRFSIIVPVYNRPEEMVELLESLSRQTFQNFEIVVVEDGSSIKSEKVIKEYQDRLNIRYFFKKNEGPSIGRNYGLAKSSGNYFLFFDSDCIIPKHYMATVYRELSENFADAYGGPDRARDDFSNFQKAVSYAMTSFFTTGGIRGGKKKVDKFYPRSFNLGFSDAVYRNMNGFPITHMHPGEDMVFAVEMIKRGFTTRLINDAYVFHKRRISFRKFYKQVFGFGKTRYIISWHYPETFKIFFLFPAFFTLGALLLVFLTVTLSIIYITPLFLYLLVVFIDAWISNSSFRVAILSVCATIVQLCGYGIGFLSAFWKHRVLNKDELGVFKKPFYKV